MARKRSEDDEVENKEDTAAVAVEGEGEEAKDEPLTLDVQVASPSASAKASASSTSQSARNPSATSHRVRPCPRASGRNAWNDIASLGRRASQVCRPGVAAPCRRISGCPAPTTS